MRRSILPPVSLDLQYRLPNFEREFSAPSALGVSVLKRLRPRGRIDFRNVETFVAPGSKNGDFSKFRERFVEVFKMFRRCDAIILFSSISRRSSKKSPPAFGGH